MISALIDLNRADDEGLVAQLTSQLRNLIATGRLGKGRTLPSSRRLASDLGVCLRYAVQGGSSKLLAIGGATGFQKRLRTIG